MIKTIASIPHFPKNVCAGDEWYFARQPDNTGLKWPKNIYKPRINALKTATRQHELAQFDLAPKVLEFGLIRIGPLCHTGYRTEVAEVSGYDDMRAYFDWVSLTELRKTPCFQEFFEGLQSVETKFGRCHNDIHWGNLGLIRRNGSLRLCLIDCGDKSSN